MVGRTRSPSEELKASSAAEKAFDTPKPERFILTSAFWISTREGDLVLDSFLGSGTTAAVARQDGSKMDWHRGRHIMRTRIRLSPAQWRW
ncbi:MAG: hypothetical protein IPH71_13620 [Proteobacteria bacterium]|nr:hypothetical protein [Pseudomonadota bacterium]